MLSCAVCHLCAVFVMILAAFSGALVYVGSVLSGAPSPDDLCDVAFVFAADLGA